MRKPLRAWLAAAALFAAVAGECAPAHQQAQAGLAVTAVVPRHASIRMAQPTSITVSEADVARGYVEIAAPVEVTVQSNVPQGYTLFFQRHGDHVRTAHVHGLPGPLLVGGDGASAVRPAAGRGMWREILQLRFRFDLAAGTAAGEHAWPLHISMMSQ